MQAPPAHEIPALGIDADLIAAAPQPPINDDAALPTQPPSFQETLSELSRVLQNLRPAAVSPMARPSSYSGEGECSGFLLQCRLYMEINANQFVSESAKISFILSLLTGRALNWAQALWNSNAPALQSLSSFVEHFQIVFSQTTNAISVHNQLLRLRQGRSTVSEYALQFRTIAASSGWNEIALSAYRQGLNPDICLQLAIYEDSIGIEKLIQRFRSSALHVSV